MGGAVNRVLLALTGLLLVALGGSVLTVGLGVTPPTWWIHQGKHDVLLTRHERIRWQGTDWWWPTVIAALALALLLALWWLSAVLRRRRLSEVLVDTGDGEEAWLRGRAMEEVLAGEATAMDGVEEAEVTVTGRPGRPQTLVRLMLRGPAAPGDIVHRLTTDALSKARDSARLTSLPTTVLLRTVRRRPQRVT